MQKINGLFGLEAAAVKRKSVILVTGRSHFMAQKPFPAAVVMNFQGSTILRLIKYGLYIYEPKHSKGLFEITVEKEIVHGLLESRTKINRRCRCPV